LSSLHQVQLMMKATAFTECMNIPALQMTNRMNSSRS
jgi:hypothetical protein